MRITTRLSTAAESGFIAAPQMAHDGDYYTLADGKIDEAAVRRELANTDGITFSGDDDRNVIAMTVELLDRMKQSMKRLMASNACVRNTVKGEPKQAAERRFDKGRFAYVRVDISRKTNVLRVAISVSNPRNAVGGAEAFATSYAQSIADNIVAIRDALKETDGRNHLELVEGDGCAGMFARSERYFRRRIEAEKIATCERRTASGYCSPCNFACPNFKGGKCVEVTE